MSPKGSTDDERSELARELGLARGWLDFILGHVCEEVYFTDTEGRYVLANDAALKEFGHRTVEGVEVNKIISHMIVLRADGTVRPMDEAPPLRALRGEIIHDEEQILRTPRAGELRHRQVSAAPIRSPDGRIVGSVAVVRDVSDLRRPDAAPLAKPVFAGSRPVMAGLAARAKASRNVEIKARLARREEVESLARALADQGPFDLSQDDTFFACAAGRLKLRELSPARGELIFYRRSDTPGPKLCEYTIVPAPAPALLRAALGESLGVIGRVRKMRRLYLAGATRIHLDEVEGLGSYLEIEVVLEDTQSASEGEATAERLLGELGIARADLVSGAYVDLLSGAPQG